MAKWRVDERVGCVAVYAGKHQNCLSGASEWPYTALYRHGVWRKKKKAWHVNRRDVLLARFVCWALNWLDGRP